MTVEGHTLWLNKVIELVTSRMSKATLIPEYGAFYLDLFTQILDVCTGDESVDVDVLKRVIQQLSTIMGDED